MEEPEILEGNKLIAEFMGLVANPSDRGVTYGVNPEVVNGTLYAEEWIRPKYHDSWDSLYAVILKVRNTFFEMRSSTERAVVEYEGIIWNWKEMDRGGCFQRIVRFIKWQNELRND